MAFIDHCSIRIKCCCFDWNVVNQPVKRWKVNVAKNLFWGGVVALALVILNKYSASFNAFMHKSLTSNIKVYHLYDALGVLYILGLCKHGYTSERILRARVAQERAAAQNYAPPVVPVVYPSPISEDLATTKNLLALFDSIEEENLENIEEVYRNGRNNGRLQFQRYNLKHSEPYQKVENNLRNARTNDERRDAFKNVSPEIKNQFLFDLLNLRIDDACNSLINELSNQNLTTPNGRYALLQQLHQVTSGNNKIILFRLLKHCVKVSDHTTTLTRHQLAVIFAYQVFGIQLFNGNSTESVSDRDADMIKKLEALILAYKECNS